jgi:hypothetical protein
MESAIGVSLTLREYPGYNDPRTIQIAAASGKIHLDDVVVSAEELERCLQVAPRA